MLDMHTDMQGSAVALGVLLAAATLGVPYEIDLWLAITENRISARAYKSQDVVTALNGTTIQVIHTDAEGRMVLADTLALAARSKPDFIIDYATLTGACVTALTSRYSGVFCNRDRSLRETDRFLWSISAKAIDPPRRCAQNNPFVHNCQIAHLALHGLLRYVLAGFQIKHFHGAATACELGAAQHYCGNHGQAPRTQGHSPRA